MLEKDKLYTTKEIAEFLNLSELTITRRCRKWDIDCINIWSELRSIYRIKWEVLLDYIKM